MLSNNIYASVTAAAIAGAVLGAAVGAAAGIGMAPFARKKAERAMKCAKSAISHAMSR